MGKRVQLWWESRRARAQIGIAFLVIAPILFAVHEVFFPLLQWYDSLLYAVIEAPLIALAITFATQSELAARARREQLQHSQQSDPESKS